MAWGTSVTKLGLGVVGVALLVFSLGVAVWEIRARRAAEDRAAAVGRWVATLLFGLALLLGGGTFFIAFIRPFFE